MILNKQQPPAPSKKEEESFKDLEMQILNQVLKSLKGHRQMEAYFLAWTSIEQFMLPRLIRFIAKELKVILPKDFSTIQISHLIRNYYFLTQDKELYDQLEKARKNRNKIVHEMYEKEDWKSIHAEYKKSLKKDIAPLLGLFSDRFNGQTSIPVLTLYSKGWNDGLEKIKNKISEGI